MILFVFIYITHHTSVYDVPACFADTSYFQLRTLFALDLV